MINTDLIDAFFGMCFLQFKKYVLKLMPAVEIPNLPARSGVFIIARELSASGCKDTV